MPNMISVIQNHNANLLSKHTTPVLPRSGSCHQKSECPLDNKCLSESLVYKAAVSQTSQQINKYYYGTCEKIFKDSTTVILLHLGIKKNQESTEPSKHIWELNVNNIQYQISGDIA